MKNKITNTQTSSSSSKPGSFSSGGGTKRLRLIFLSPVVIITVIMMLALSMTSYKHMNDTINDDDIHITTSTQDFYNKSVSHDIQIMQATMYALAQDEKLSDLLAQGDRAALLHYTAPLFENLKRDFSITHFSFTGTDKVNLLRVHAPSRYGDVIDRFTMQKAQNSGSPAHGVELGPLGTFTLRLVAPWYNKHTQTLIGYVELGIEIDNVIDKLQDDIGVRGFTLINKEFLDRETWEKRISFGHKSHWDLFPKFVLNEKYTDKISILLAERISNGERITNNSILYMEKENTFYRVDVLPLQDAGGRYVAQMILFIDISKEVRSANKTVYLVSIFALIMGGVLILFFYLLVGRVGQHIETNENELRKLSRHDGLTGLYNHRTFYMLLEEELERAYRYKHSLSLLMLDIDHFKEVNDTCGHPAGDMVLRSLSKRLKDRMRTTDWVCRYGGEEIMVILTETDIPMAENIAEDLRILIEEEPFDIGNGQSISITVSIGIATYPVHAQEVQMLVSKTDKALYKAKESGRNCVCVYQPQV